MKQSKSSGKLESNLLLILASAHIYKIIKGNVYTGPGDLLLFIIVYLLSVEL